MPDFDESSFETMTDEELRDYLAHDAELPLAFVRGSEAVLCAASVLSARQTETLPAPETALEVLEERYLAVPYDGATLWDNPPRYAAAATQTPAAVQKPKAPAQRARRKAPPVEAAPAPPSGEARAESAEAPLPPPVYYAPTPKKKRGSLSAALLVILLILLLGGFAVLYIVYAFRSTIGSEAANAVSPASAAVSAFSAQAEDGARRPAPLL